MSIRLAATVAAAALLCACSAPKAATSGTAAPSAPAGASAAASAAAPSGPPNAPVAQAGQPGGIPLEPALRAELDATVAKAGPSVRPRLRYALATGDDGKRHLVVYDGEGLGPSGRHKGRPHEYVVFKVLNATNGEHYDPQQNSIVAPIPPPPQRESPVTK
jgi:hypothetical protein